MATLNEIASLLAERAGKPFDTPFQEELKFIIKYWAVALTRNSLDKSPMDRRFFHSKLTVPLVKTSEVECLNYGCILRSEAKIPKPLRANNLLFDFVGSADFTSASFSYRLPYQLDIMEKGSRFTGWLPTYTYVDNYIFINNPPSSSFKLLGILYIPEDLNQIKNFKQCSNTTINSCNSDDDEFPLSSDLLQTLITSILKTELSFNLNRINEVVNVDSTK